MSGYDFSQDTANEMLEAADKRNDELERELELVALREPPRTAIDEVRDVFNEGAGTILEVASKHAGELDRLRAAMRQPPADRMITSGDPSTVPPADVAGDGDAKLAYFGMQAGSTRVDCKADATGTVERATPAPTILPADVAGLAERIENYYSFECEGGPLRLCADWITIKGSITALAQERDRLKVRIAELEFLVNQRPLRNVDDVARIAELDKELFKVVLPAKLHFERRVDALEAQLAEARRDADQYRHIREHGIPCACGDECGAPCGPDLDDAVVAAMQDGKP